MRIFGSILMKYFVETSISKVVAKHEKSTLFLLLLYYLRKKISAKILKWLSYLE